MTKKNRQLLFSVKKNDLIFQFFRGSGAGGQHRNKKDTACRCIHKESGAIGTASEFKSQHQNKKTAFTRMARSDTFQKWAKLQAARLSGGDDEGKPLKEQIKDKQHDIAFGNHVRSYIFDPYQMVKDNRSGFKTSDAQRILDGDLDELIDHVLRNGTSTSS